MAVVTKNFWQKRLGGDRNVIGRSITLDGMPHTIVGVLPNMPATWFGANPIAEVWTTKPFQLPGFSARTNDARHELSARDRPVKPEHHAPAGESSTAVA